LRGQQGRQTRLRCQAPARDSRLATSRSLAALVAQNSFPNGTGILGRLSLLDRAESGSLAESAARATNGQSAQSLGFRALRDWPSQPQDTRAATMQAWLTGAIITGDGSTPTADIQTVIGRPPTSFHTFAERHATAWTSKEQR
jgi:hypothetical protein